MVAVQPRERWVASPNGVVPHVGLSSVRLEALGTPFNQRATARPECGAGLRVAAADDRRDVAESVGGGLVRRSPLAGRSGCLGDGTPGGAQRLLRSARPDGLRALRATENAECRMQNAESGAPQHATRNTFHVSRLHLLPPLPVLARPGVD